MATATKKAAVAAGKTESGTRALANWEEALARKAKSAKKVASNASTGKSVLSFKGGKLNHQGGLVPGNQLDVVVLSSIMENNFFSGPYDPKNPTPPSCYAFGSPEGDDENMGPNKAHFEGHEDDIQTETGRCADCPQNEWGSAGTGRGKACKNQVSLAMILAGELDGLAKGGAHPEVFYAKLPVTSAKAWRGFMNECDTKHPLEFVATISTEPVGSGDGFIVTASLKEEVPRQAIGPLLELSDREDARWGKEPYPVAERPQQRGRQQAAPRGTAAPRRKY